MLLDLPASSRRNRFVSVVSGQTLMLGKLVVVTALASFVEARLKGLNQKKTPPVIGGSDAHFLNPPIA